MTNKTIPSETYAAVKERMNNLIQTIKDQMKRKSSGRSPSHSPLIARGGKRKSKRASKKSKRGKSKSRSRSGRRRRSTKGKRH